MGNNIADFGDQDENYQDENPEQQDYQEGHQDSDYSEPQYDDPQYDLSAVDESVSSISGQAEAVMGEAIKRIEQANLYQTVLKHDLFAPGSARQEILDKVQLEIRDFILDRLEVLLGMKPDFVQDKKPVKVELPFDEDQVDALKALANRALKRDQQATTPAQPQINQVATVSQVSAPVPTINRVSVKPTPAPRPTPKPVFSAPQQPQRQQATPVRPQPQQRSAPVPTEKPRRRRRSNNVSVVTDNAGNVISDKDYSQAVPSGNAPATLRMPSQGEMNAMAAAQSARNEASVGGNRLLNVALKDAIGKASRLPDEE